MQVENYDPTSKEFYTGTFNIFEYVFGFGKYLISKFPELFGEFTQGGATDSIGFNVCTVCLGLDINQMDQLPDRLLKVDLEKFEGAVLSTVFDVASRLKPFISLRANKKKDEVRRKPIIYHSEYQIVSFIGKVFRFKYDSNLEEATSLRAKKLALLDSISYHYLYDILREFWRGSGDAKIRELLQDGSRYESNLYRENWENILNEWFEFQLQRKEQRRVNIKDVDILFLKYIYAHLLSSYQDNSTTEFEIEHLVPVAPLKRMSGEGLPISAASNLCLIEKILNKDKGELTIYQYFDKQVASEEITQEQAEREIEKLERFTFTLRPDLEFVESMTASSYFSFLRERFSRLKEKFYELNSIQKQPL